MDESVLMGFDKLKLSAFSKYSAVKGEIHDVTIGPNSPLAFKRDKKCEPRRVIKIEEKTTARPLHEDNSYAIQQILKECEVKRRELVQEEIKKRAKKFEEFSRAQRREQEKQWLIQQQRFIESMKEKENKIVEAVQEYESTKSDQNEKLVKHYQELIQKKMMYEQQLEENKERQRILNENIEKIKKCQIDFRIFYQEIIAVIKMCTSNEELKKILAEDFKLLKTLPDSIEEIITKCKNYNIESEDVTRALNVVTQVQSLKAQIQEAVLKINNKKKEDVKPLPQPQQVQQPISIANTAVRVTPVINVKTPQMKLSDLDLYISPLNLKRYSEITQFLGHYSQLFQELSADESLKQFKFDCKKAVNIPVNTITAVSAEHLKDKFNKLSNLLSGKTIEVSEKQVNAARHPQGIPFCMNLMAQRFVLQGDLLISSNPDAAFSYATIIVSLWNAFPEFGQLLLGYFYTTCPYLVPFYIPKTDNQTTEEYYVSLGYQYKNGQIEKQDKFLKRMTGIMRLYFAILIAKPKREQPQNPHNITNAWRYFVSLLRLEPQLNITATAIHTFLETCGFEMETTYGAQFRKLVHILSDRYMVNLKQIDSGGPVSRLESLLKEYRENGRFEKPNGILRNNFW